tara:strand:- start:60 stop:596 length:537 start_codon:yes stop_codon:yes gene_type:complete
MKGLINKTMRLSILLSLLLICSIAHSQVEKSDFFLRGTTSSAGSTVEAQIDDKPIIVQQTIGQSGIIGVAHSENAMVFQGFIQPELLEKILTPEIPQILEALIYPSPFIDQLYIEFDFIPKTNISVNVYDIMGQVVWSNTFASSRYISVNPTNLTYGYYFLKVECDGMQRVEKILKSK